jgi:predicted MPP superfamily phosphohydrolase
VKLYFAGCQAEEMRAAIRACKVKNILVSFYYVGDSLKYIYDYFGYEIDIMLDSGGFTARTKDRKIDIHKYIEFVKKNKQYVKHYFVLDNKRENLNLTKQNLKLMEEAGLNPIPIYHTDEPFDYFLELCEKYSYIGVGGAVRSYTNIFFTAKQHDVKIHLLGNTSPRILLKYKPYSADSISWLSGGMHGRVLVKTPFGFKSARRKSLRIYSKLLSSKEGLSCYGVSFDDFAEANEGKGDYQKMMVFSCLTFLEFEKYVNEGGFTI